MRAFLHAIDRETSGKWCSQLWKWGARAGALSVLASALIGCAGQTALSSGGSYGMPNAGMLRGGHALSRSGAGFVLARPSDPTRFAAPTLLGALDRAFASVAQRFPGTPAMRIGDLSYERGGRHPRHGSHRSGRDVDLIFHAVDAAGIPVPGSGFRAYDRFGVARGGVVSLEAAGEGGALESDQAAAPAPSPAAAPAVAPAQTSAPRVAGAPKDDSPVLFDVARNWHFVRTLLLDPQGLVQWIFCSHGIKALLLQYAVAHEPDPDALVRAATVLHQPSEGRPHNDHFHVRVLCSAEEQTTGCTDYGPVWPWLRDRVEKLGVGDLEPLDDAALVRLLLEDLPPLPLIARGPARRRIAREDPRAGRIARAELERIRVIQPPRAGDE